MNKIRLFSLACIVLLSFGACLSGQDTYKKEIKAHRKAIKQQLFQGGPEIDLSKLRYYTPDEAYRIKATVTVKKDTGTIQMPTSNGATKVYARYGELIFRIQNEDCRLTLFKPIGIPGMPGNDDRLFLPFKDATSGKATYGGGRYLDIRIADIAEGTLWLDFNKAYNPYCAYADMYACPIPPTENHLKVSILAGEKTYPGH